MQLLVTKNFLYCLLYANVCLPLMTRHGPWTSQYFTSWRIIQWCGGLWFRFWRISVIRWWLYHWWSRKANAGQVIMLCCWLCEYFVVWEKTCKLKQILSTLYSHQVGQQGTRSKWKRNQLDKGEWFLAWTYSLQRFWRTRHILRTNWYCWRKFEQKWTPRVSRRERGRRWRVDGTRRTRTTAFGMCINCICCIHLFSDELAVVILISILIVAKCKYRTQRKLDLQSEMKQARVLLRASPSRSHRYVYFSIMCIQ